MAVGLAFDVCVWRWLGYVGGGRARARREGGGG